MAKFFGFLFAVATWLGFLAVFPVGTLLVTGILLTLFLTCD